MAKRAPTRWTFFVDESGQFSEPDACVVVGGLLVEERLVGREPGKLERALRTAAPSLPWPLHTAHLNLPVTHALEARFTGPGSEGSVTARALEEKGVVLQRCLEALAAGAWPDYDDLKLLDRHLQARESREHRRWRRRVTDVRAAIGAVLEGLVAASDPPRAAVITSSESEPCEAMAHERYLPLLEDALERALRVAALHDGEHEVWMHVLSKNVLDPTIGKKIPLLKRHIGDRLTKLPPIARVRGIVHDVFDFRDGVHPGLFCADFICNRARGRLEDGKQPLAHVEGDIEQALRVPVRTRDRSHLSAAGVARDYVHAAQRGERPPELGQGTIKRWASEQAREWAGGSR